MVAAHLRHNADAVADAAAGGVGSLDGAEPVPEAPIDYIKMGPDGREADRNGKAEGTGKGSRWNAVRHGCMAQLLLPADLQSEVDAFTAALTELYRPTDAFEVSRVATMGRVGAQLERTGKLLVIDRQRTMDRAILSWNDDRGIYVNSLAEKLGQTRGVVAALAGSKQGAEWLLRAWRGLAEVTEFTGRWTDAQIQLALDLLDARPELREDCAAKMAASGATELAKLIADEVAWLEGKLEVVLNPLDHARKMMAAAGMPGEEDAETKRLRKQEAKLKLDYRRARAELMESRAQAAAAAAAAGQSPVSEPKPAQDPVMKSTRPAPKSEPVPTARPHTSNTVYNFLNRRSHMKGFELPATATNPARTVSVWFPYPGGGDPQTETATESAPETEPAPEIEPQASAEPQNEPASLDTPAAAGPRPARSASKAATTVPANQRRDQERHKRRAQEKKARKAARRNRR